MRPVTRRNLPVLLLLPTMICGFFAVFLPIMAKLAMPKERALKFVAGSVEQAPMWLKGSDDSKLPIIEIRVKTDDGLYNLDEQDLDHAREIMKLRPGDRITARVVPLASYHNVWELKRDGVTIQSYQESYLYQVSENAQTMTIALWCGLVASLSLTVAIFLRMHFGAWGDPISWEPADAAGSVQGAVRLPNYPLLSSADYPRTYYMSQGWEAFHLIVGFGAICVGVLALRSALTGAQVRVTLVWGILWGIVFCGIGIIAILDGLKYHVVLFANSKKFTSWSLPKF